jgi:hypothetical protein
MHGGEIAPSNTITPSPSDGRVAFARSLVELPCLKGWYALSPRRSVVGAQAWVMFSIEPNTPSSLRPPNWCSTASRSPVPRLMSELIFSPIDWSRSRPRSLDLPRSRSRQKRNQVTISSGSGSTESHGLCWCTRIGRWSAGRPGEIRNLSQRKRRAPRHLVLLDYYDRLAGSCW